MKSISTLFLRDRETRLVINKPYKSVDWVLSSKGTPMRKWDGIAILVDRGIVYHRIEWHSGSPVPDGFIKCQDVNSKYPDASIPGWVPVDDRFKTAPKSADETSLQIAWNLYIADLQQLAVLQEAKDKAAGKVSIVNRYAPEKKEVISTVPAGTYELCGPDIRGNHEDLSHPKLYRHDAHSIAHVPRTYDGLRKFLSTYEGEGIVWHYKMGDILHMAKLKRHDFGFFGRPAKDVVKTIAAAK